jgi:ABC-type antimicrobial peptide transport system permease subunit
MIRVHPLVREHLRDNAQQAYLNVFGMAFVVMLIVTLMEVKVPAGHPNRLVVAIRNMLEALAWLGITAAILFMAINRFSQVRERTRHFGILRVLGSSFSFVIRLLLQETVFVAIPATIVGIVLATVHELFVAAVLSGFFVLRTSYASWLPAGVIAALIFFLVSVYSAWSAFKLDVLEALSYED